MQVAPSVGKVAPYCCQVNLIISGTVKLNKKRHCCIFTCKQGHFVECPIQLAQENVHKAIFGKLTSILSALVVHHHLMSPAQINLHTCTHTKRINEKCQK